MVLTLKKLLHLPVETKNGVSLGEVCGLEMDTERHAVTHYVVKPSYVPRLLANELLVAASQVISITEEKIVVEDGAVPVAEPSATPAAL